MSARAKSNSSETENMCVVCFKNTDIYSIGLCDHPVCYECSTRMRVLCRQNECPICRQDMPKVIFTYQIQPYRVMKQQLDHSALIDRKFGVWFTSKDIKDAYYSLLEHNCTKCTRREAFRTFIQLKEHMRRDHELNYCDLCVENIRIFTWERRCYTRSELAQHRRKGDPDDTSHRGHPLCQFCDTRYMDSDELFRHLRKDHEFCHFCDADGLHHYYPSYDYLREHFKSEHFLCEEGDCIHEKFTSVFRSEIDLKAHRASVHGKYLGKAASKQARTLDFEFTLAPRPRPNNARLGKKPFLDDERLEEEGAVGYEHTIYTEPGGAGGATLTAQDFPSLGGGNASAPTPRLQGGNVTIRHNIRRGKEGLARTNENFPALSGDSSTVRFSVNSSTVIPPDHVPTSTAPKVSIHVNHRPNGITTHISQNASANSSSIRVRPRSDAFPALGAVTVPEEAQWVKLKKEPKEPKPKVHKVAPAPVLPSRDSPTDFPSLNGSKTDQFMKSSKKSSSLTVPVTNSWTPSETEVEIKDSKNNNKNKKKKGSKSTTADTISNSSPSVVNNSSSNQNNKSSQQSINKTSSASESSNKTNNSKKVTQTEKSDKTKQQQNGLVKKRSELKIDSLHISQPTSSNTNSTNTQKQQKFNGTTNNNEDFPSLTNKPPPGFMMQAPPGFAANDLTFTNSSGQSYSILPTHKFSPPPNFPHRNKNLVESFMASLASNDAILEFKNLSAMFRNGLYTAAQYYEHCNAVMKTDFAKIFPELLVLLPDIEKQQELFAIHCKTPANRKGLEVCATCAQILSSCDLRSHLATHTLENQFPALGTQELSSVWRK